MLANAALSTTVDKKFGNAFNDFECPKKHATDFTNRHIRRAFQQKIFTLLMFQFLCIFSFVTLWLCVLSPAKIPDKNPNSVFIASIIMAIVVVSMACSEYIRRTSPYNRFYLVTFTCAESLLVASVAVQFDANTTLISTGIKALYSLALTLFSVQRKYDFSCGRAILMFLIFCSILSGAAAIFCRDYLVQTITAGSCSLLVFCFFMLDINIMLNENSLCSREHDFAILNLYIMLYVMRVMGACIVGNWLIIIVFL